MIDGKCISIEHNAEKKEKKYKTINWYNTYHAVVVCKQKDHSDQSEQSGQNDKSDQILKRDQSDQFDRDCKLFLNKYTCPLRYHIHWDFQVNILNAKPNWTLLQALLNSLLM